MTVLKLSAYAPSDLENFALSWTNRIWARPGLGRKSAQGDQPLATEG